jgi:hypothetical protein
VATATDLLISEGVRDAFAGEPCATAARQGLQDEPAHRLPEDFAVRCLADPHPVLR